MRSHRHPLSMRRSRARSWLRSGTFAMLVASLASASWTDTDPVFDARGFNKNREFFSQLPFEHIDPMTGNLLLTFTDVVLPGNAGFQLRIQRSYNSKIYRFHSPGRTGPTAAATTLGTADVALASTDIASVAEEPTPEVSPMEPVDPAAAGGVIADESAPANEDGTSLEPTPAPEQSPAPETLTASALSETLVMTEATTVGATQATVTCYTTPGRVTDQAPVRRPGRHRGRVRHPIPRPLLDRHQRRGRRPRRLPPRFRLRLLDRRLRPGRPQPRNRHPPREPPRPVRLPRREKV